MKPRVDALLVAAFGSETRVLTLAALANSTAPLTAYRVAKIAGLRPPKVYDEIRRARASGLVTQSAGKLSLRDPDLRSLLRKRVRLFGWDDWRSGKDRWEPIRKTIANRLRTMSPPRFRGERGWSPRHREVYHRDPRKNESLREMGLRKSSHG